MDRREFITLLGGAALAWPSAAPAQPAEKIHRIGYLSLASAEAEATRFDAFRAGLAALGYVEGRNLLIEVRWLDGGKYEQLASSAAQLVELNVDVLVTYSTLGVSTAKRATATIPIVFASVGDAVVAGLVSGLARPGGNVTGTSYFLPQLATKRLELLKEAMLSLAQVGVLVNPANLATEPVLSAMRLTAQSLELTLSEFAARDAGELEAAFAAMKGKSVTAFVVAEDPTLIYNSHAITTLALRHRLAACGFLELAQAGGFLAYGIDFNDMWRHAATVVDKILKGAKPGDLPVEQTTTFVTMVNLKTAQAIGVDLPTSLLARADQVIE